MTLLELIGLGTCIYWGTKALNFLIFWGEVDKQADRRENRR